MKRSRWIRRRCRRWCAWPRSRPRSGAPRTRSRPTDWRSRRRPIRKGWARRGPASATSPSARSPTSRRRSTRTGTRCCRPPTICPRSPGWRGAWCASATGPTPRRRCAGWRPSRPSAKRASDTWSRWASCLSGPAEDPEGAADAFEGALAVHPSNAVAIDRLDEILTELEEPSRLAAALGRFLEVTPDARDRRMRLAALWSGPLGSNGRAVDELRIVVSGNARDVEARAELARVLEAADRLPEAITEHIALMRLEPLRVDSLRALRRLCERSGQRRRALRTAAAMVALGLTEPDDVRMVRESRVRWTPEANGTLNAGEFDSYIRHADERHPGDGVAGGDVRGAAAPVRPGAGGLGGDQAGPADRALGRSDPGAGRPRRDVARRRGHVRRLPGALGRDAGRDRGRPAARAAGAGEPAVAAAAGCVLADRAPAGTPARGDVRHRAHPGQGSRPARRRGRAHRLSRLRPRRVARGAAQRRGAEDRAHAAAAPAARLRAGRAVVP